MFKELFVESKGNKGSKGVVSLQQIKKILKKDGEVQIIDGNEVWVSIHDIDDGYGYGLDQYDNDREIDLKNDSFRLA